jgi:hypothetical protein
MVLREPLPDAVNGQVTIFRLPNATLSLWGKAGLCAGARHPSIRVRWRADDPPGSLRQLVYQPLDIARNGGAADPTACREGAAGEG